MIISTEALDSASGYCGCKLEDGNIITYLFAIRSTQFTKHDGDDVVAETYIHCIRLDYPMLKLLTLNSDIANSGRKIDGGKCVHPGARHL